MRARQAMFLSPWAGRLQERGITRLGSRLALTSAPPCPAALEKLRLTRDIPRCPGAYLFVDQDDHVLYVGKADKLRSGSVPISSSATASRSKSPSGDPAG